MKVAIVHDWLNTKRGGAENVALELAAMFPDAPVYTLLYNHQLYDDTLPKERVHSSSLQRLPQWLKKRSRYLLPFLPQAIESFDLSQYDVVISSSTGWGKGVITKPETLHICYCHSPMRFVWDYWPRYVSEQGVGPLRRAAIHLLTSRMRLWDYYSAARVDRWIANSKTTQSRISKYYHQSSSVIYPGVDIDAFTPSAAPKGGYYATLSTLTPYKKVELAIEAANQLGRELVIIGDGIDRSRLEALAGPSVRFAGRVSNAERAQLLAGARALIFPSEEDFGIAPVEAMASGTPVIAYNKGGLKETVIDGKTGRFFEEPTAASLIDAIQRFEGDTFNTADLVRQAKQFDSERFRRELHREIAQALKEHRRDLGI